MPIRRKVADFGDDLGEYLLALIRHWRPIVSGAALALISFVYGVFEKKAVPANLYLSLLVAAAIVAGFLAWRDEYKKRLAALATISDADDGSSECDRFIVLAGQLRHFLNARRAEYDAEFDVGALPTLHEQYLDMQEIAIGDTGKRARKKTALKSKHNATTLQAYGDQFANRVLSAERRLREFGVNEPRHLAKYPSTIADIETIVSDLENASAAVTESQLAAIDVWLEGSYPGPFALQARGHACEVRTGPIVIESSVIGTEKDGDKVRPMISTRYTLEFPIKSDLRDGEKEIVTPSLLCGEGYSRSTWPEKESGRSGIAEFFRMAVFVRNRPNYETDFRTLGESEQQRLADHWQQPLRLGFDITFWNREHTQQWKRSELLVYEPATATAFVRHIGTPERFVAGVRERP